MSKFQIVVIIVFMFGSAPETFTFGIEPNRKLERQFVRSDQSTIAPADHGMNTSDGRAISKTFLFDRIPITRVKLTPE